MNVMLYEIAVTRVEQKTLIIEIESETLGMALGRAEKIASDTDFRDIAIDCVDYCTDVVSESKN